MITDPRFKVEERDLGRLHDVVLEATGYSLSDRYIKDVYNSLPFHIKGEIQTHGLDAPIGDEIYRIFQRNKPTMWDDTDLCIAVINTMWIIKMIEENGMHIADFMRETKGSCNPKCFIDLLAASEEKEDFGIYNTP